MTGKNYEEADMSHNLSAQLEALRILLQRHELEWSSRADTLMSNMMDTNSDIPASPQDLDMLSLVVDAILQGDDIAKTYPTFYQRLQISPDLQQSLFDILEMMSPETENAGSPIFAPLNLDFLQRSFSPPPVITHRPPNRWRAAWQILSTALTQQFTLSWDSYRETFSGLDEENILLLENEFMIGASAWQVILEGVSRPEKPHELGLFLSAAVDEEPFPPLQATVQWGMYQETAVFDAYGQAYFPPLDLRPLLDETGTAILHQLHLYLEPV